MQLGGGSRRGGGGGGWSWCRPQGSGAKGGVCRDEAEGGSEFSEQAVWKMIRAEDWKAFGVKPGGSPSEAFTETEDFHAYIHVTLWSWACNRMGREKRRKKQNKMGNR